MPRFASIIDIENLAHDNRRALDAGAVAPVMAYVRALTGQAPATLALQAALAPRLMSAVVGPWRLRLVESGPDRADAALLEAADAYVAAGVTDLIVVSGDRCFSALAQKTRLHVVAFEDRLSRDLSRVATSVVLLDSTTPRLRAA